MMAILIRWGITALALVVAAWIVPGIEVTDNPGWAAVIVTAAVLGLMNAIVRPVLILLSCGCIVLTLGIFLLFINGFTLWLSAWIAENWLDLGFHIDGYWPAFFGGILVSIVSFVLSLIIPDPDGFMRGGRR